MSSSQPTSPGIPKRMLLVDQSLKGPGGHHFDYTLQVSKVALGFCESVVLGSHRRFGNAQPLLAALSEAATQDGGVSEVASDGTQAQGTSSGLLESLDETRLQVWAGFWETTYSPHSDLVGIRQLTRPRSRWQRLGHRLSRRWQAQRSAQERLVSDDALAGATAHLEPEQREVVQRFANDLCQYLVHVQPTADDLLYFTTVSELEFLAMGLVAGEHPELAEASWHVQFHYDLFAGRPHEYPSQTQTTSVQRARTSFQTARRLFGEQRVSLYTTSEPLSQQYDWLEIGPVPSLVYPINPKFRVRESQPILVGKDRAEATVLEPQRSAPKEKPLPLRLTFAGGIRREKGQKRLQQLLDEVNDDLLETGQACLVVQRSERRKWRKPQLELQLPTSPRIDSANDSRLIYVPHPLSEADYVQLIHDAGVGLLLYDGRAYYARRAGVLGEFLAAGVPVVVPAACWLGDQVEQVNRVYWRDAFEGAVESLSPTAISGGGAVCDVQPQESTVAVVGKVCVDLPQADLKHVVMGWQPLSGEANWRDVLPSRWPLTVDSQGEAWFHLPKLLDVPLTNYRLSFRWQFGDEPLRVRSLELKSIDSKDQGAVPWGSIGLVAADNDDVAPLLRELVRHRSHYQQQAVAHATRWYADHDPRATVARLLSDCGYIGSGLSDLPEPTTRRAA